MIDTHAHLCSPHFSKDDIPNVIARAISANTQSIVTVAENLTECHQIHSLAELYTTILPCAGLHPIQRSLDPANSHYSVKLCELNPVLDYIHHNHTSLSGIGEIGLDFSPHIIGKDTASTQEYKTTQTHIFSEFIKLSNRYSLAMTIHSRNAGHYAIKALEENGARNALLHAFDGKEVYARKAVQLGYLFSIPPSVVRTPGLQTLVARVPLTHLVLESDAPALGPIKGVGNEPMNVILSAMEIARIKKVDLQEVISMTTHNASKLFKL